MTPMYSNCWLSAEDARLGWGRWRTRSRSRFLVGCRKAFAWVTLLACLCSAPARSWGYTSDGPEVQQMLEKAIPYLEKNGRTTDGVGADCLVGMALLKAGKDLSHPLVQAAIVNSRKLAETVAKQGLPNYLYNEAIACIFLCEIGPTTYAPEINIFLQALVKRQRPNGAFGYFPHSYDDTSQTQYGVLAYWAAHHAGMDVPAAGVEAALLWLLRTHNSDGGWAYSPRDPGNYERSNQAGTTHSMSAAALSSVYICAHLLGFGADAQRPVKKEEKPELPPALQKIETEASKRKWRAYLQASTANAQQVAAATAVGNAWFAKNLTYEVPQWTHYYMYAVERYKSFQELVEGKVVPEPAWYNDGVEYLKKTQLADGSWHTQGSHIGAPVHTTFAMLFLTRSSQKSIKKATLDEGLLIGGMGLPKDLMNARLQDGQIVTPQMIQDVDELLDLLNSTEDKDFDPSSLPGGLSLNQDLTKRNSQLERLRQLVTNENFEARLAAVKTLARARELDNVPALIFALTDPDPKVVQEAESGLRFISRKFAGFGLPSQPTQEQLESSRVKWRVWYLSIRPDGQLLD